MSTYKRVILKLSGEALGENGRLFDQDLISHVGRILADISKKGIELGVVIGAHCGPSFFSVCGWGFHRDAPI